MNVDRIFDTMNTHGVAYMLIGGMNFLLRHAPVLTYDVDLWVEDQPGNLERCEKALAALEAEWGTSDDDWGPVGQRRKGWITGQWLFCLTSPSGAIDIFKSVKGLESWTACRTRASEERTTSGVAFVALGDADLLACQLALPEAERKQDRVRFLQERLKGG